MSTTNKARNTGQKFMGRIKEAIGRLTGNRSLVAEGKGDKAGGSLKQAGEQVKDIGEDVTR